MDAELRKAAGEEGTENEGGESSNSHLFSLSPLSPFNFSDPPTPPPLLPPPPSTFLHLHSLPLHSFPCLFSSPFSFLPHSSLCLHLSLSSSLSLSLFLSFLQKRSGPPVPSWLQPTVPTQPRAPSRLPPCTRRIKCKCILELNLILNNAHGDTLRPPLFPSPPLRGYFLDGKFFIAAALGSTLTKLAIRYLHQVEEPQSKNVRVDTVPLFPGLPTVQFVIAYSMQ